ncbi:hypothetical protein DET48_1513 [Vibrio diazotrophicus]|uniref:Uncharacterized protein n=1 Tax=Vibrio diazotrophicus TaxID=685 RepID=A0A329E2P7_VIBDI|nr:hypothetical protein [Vibrio diazotrophicus]RAS54416.1 hypothetical protein DET48_1513 [Vibrio diazotrophicus]
MDKSCLRNKENIEELREVLVNTLSVALGDRLRVKNEIDKLRTALASKVIDEIDLLLLYVGFFDAHNRNLAYSGYHNPGGTKEARQGVKQLDRALTKLIERKGTKEAAHNSLKAGVSLLKCYADGALKELDAYIDLNMSEKIDSDGNCISIFEQLIKRVLTGDTEALQHLKGSTYQFLANLKNVGRGGARREARQNIPGIERLAEYFREACPDRQISADSKSLFYEYVIFWLNHIVELEIEEPDRHIKNAIDEMNKKMFL